MESMNIDRIKKRTEEACALFYQQKVDEGLLVLNLLLDDLESEMKFLQRTFDGKGKIGELNRLLSELMTAVEKKDFILLTDILKYKIMDELNEFYEYYTIQE